MTLQSFEEGKDYIIEDTSERPYVHLGPLGHGQCGQVSKIRDVNTGAVFACKSICIPRSRKKDNRRKVFENEVAIIRSLKKHRHIVRVFATYVSRQELGLVLHPVADRGDLGHFLDDYLVDVQDGLSPAEMIKDTNILSQAFGCLASALTFMHQHKVRHKDIKSRNILIHGNSVLFTDFGYSLDFSQLSHSTTSGHPNAYTRRYAAPEVLNSEPRNSSSDIFSLGCVFVEMLSAVSQAFQVSPEENISESIESIHGRIETAVPTMALNLRFLVPVVLSMTSSIPSERYTAAQVSDNILDAPDFCCILCRKAPSLTLPSRKEIPAHIASTQRDYHRVTCELLAVQKELNLLLQAQPMHYSIGPETRALENPREIEGEDGMGKEEEDLKHVESGSKDLDLFDQLAALEVKNDLRRSQMPQLSLECESQRTTEDLEQADFRTTYSHLLDKMIGLEIEKQQRRSERPEQALDFLLSNGSYRYTKNTDPIEIPSPILNLDTKSQLDRLMPAIAKDREIQLRIIDWLHDSLKGSGLQQLVYRNTLHDAGIDVAEVSTETLLCQASFYWDDSSCRELAWNRQHNRSSIPLSSRVTSQQLEDDVLRDLCFPAVHSVSSSGRRESLRSASPLCGKSVYREPQIMGTVVDVSA